MTDALVSQCRDCGRLLLPSEVRTPYSLEQAEWLGVDPADDFREECLAQRRVDREGRA